MPTPNQPYSANHKTWDHQGHLLPQVEYSESIRPHGEFLPAAWLPIAEAGGYFDVYCSSSGPATGGVRGEGVVSAPGCQRLSCNLAEEC